MSFLVTGGFDDPNLTALVEASRRLNVPTIDLRVRVASSPALTWDLQSGVLDLEGEPISPTGAFIRYDVFAGLQDRRETVAARSNGWFHTLCGYICASRGIRTFNRDIAQTAFYKPAVLVAARAFLQIPNTVISDDAVLLERNVEGRIAKPVAGGGYCRTLEGALAQSDIREGRLAMPALVQEMLNPPEVRIYVIGRGEFAFEMRSSALDYRENQDAEVIATHAPPREVAALRALMSELKMDFGAADFKTNRRGELTFLELNTSPMFARFDQAVDGALAEAIVSELSL